MAKSAREPRGARGFGYDPIFYLPQRSCTFAELSREEKIELQPSRQSLPQNAGSAGFARFLARLVTKSDSTF